MYSINSLQISRYVRPVLGKDPLWFDSRKRPPPVSDHYILAFLGGRLIMVGVHLKAVFTPLKIDLTEISRSYFKQYKNLTLITQINVLGCFVNFLVIFRYIWEA